MTQAKLQQLISALATLAAAIIMICVADPKLAQTWQQFAIQICLPAVAAISAIVFCWVTGRVDKAVSKLKAALAEASRAGLSLSGFDITENDVVTIITQLGTVAAALALILIKDPAKGAYWNQVVTGTILPFLLMIAGIVFVSIRGYRLKAAAERRLAALDRIMAEGDPLTYSSADIDIILKRTAGKDRVAVAEDFTVFISNPNMYDLRNCPREKRVVLSKILVEKAFQLLCEAFIWKTQLTEIPTPEQAAHWPKYSFELIKKYQVATASVCNRYDYDVLKMIVGYIHDVYCWKDGILQCQGITLDWSTFTGRPYCPADVGDYWTSLIVIN